MLFPLAILFFCVSINGEKNFPKCTSNTRRPDIVIIGKKIKEIHLETEGKEAVEACCSECEVMSICKAWNLHDQTCVLLETVERLEKDYYTVSGELSPPRCKSKVIHKDMIIIGKKIAETYLNSLKEEACCAECTKTPLCKGWTSHGQICVLMQTVERLEKDYFSVSGEMEMGYLNFNQCNLSKFQELANGTTWNNFFKQAEYGQDTTSPLIYPQDDDEIRDILSLARFAKCHVRISGATHASAGFVTSKDYEENTVVISLADYDTVPSWTRVLKETEETVRIAAGRTLLDLYQFMRPKNYFLATRPDPYFFSLAGIVSTPVHGGSVTHSFVYSLITALRVMHANGTIEEISDSRLRFYKGGYGLTGIITAVEFKVYKSPHFCMKNNLTTEDWSKDNFVSKINGRDKEAQYFEYYLTRFNQGSSKKVMWIFVNQFAGSAAEECDPFKDLTQSEKERTLEESYNRFQDSNPDIACSGSVHAPVMKQLEGMGQYGTVAARIMRNTSVYYIHALYNTFSNTTNDGLWLTQVADSQRHYGPFPIPDGAPPGMYMLYFFRVDNMSSVADRHWDIVSIWDEWFQKQMAPISPEVDRLRMFGRAEVFTPNQPCDVRYVNVTQHDYDNGAVLKTLEPGMYIAFGIAQNGNGYKYLWAKPFADLERRFVENGGRPAVAKTFCFGDGDDPRPYDAECMKDVFPLEQQKEFMKYRDDVDPEGIFFAGDATNFFKE